MEMSDMRNVATAFVVTVLVLAGAVTAQQKRQQDIELQAAIRTEMVDGDLTGAIKQYGAIAAKYKTDRSVAAAALVHMAECYQKLGDAQARKIFEQVVRDYADQKEAVTIARAGLGGNTARRAGLVTRRVWTVPQNGLISYGAVSPDGRYIPFTDWGVNGELFLHDLRTGTDRRITNGAKGGPESEQQYSEDFSVSRDGQQLAYHWFVGWKNRYELRVIGLQGTGTPQFRLLFDDPEVDYINPQDWSPDGKWIAAWMTRKQRPGQVALVSVQDGSLRVMKSVEGNGPERMFFSPDGKYLAYDLPADTTGQRDILIQRIDATAEIAAVMHPSHEVLVGWSPDGTRLLFASDRRGSNDVWALGFAGGKTQGPPELIKPDIHGLSMGITASGSLYSLASPGVNSDVQVASFDFATGQFLSTPVRVVNAFVGTNSAPTYSADGKYLAYVSHRGGGFNSGVSVIGIRTLETGQVRELSSGLNRLTSFGGWAPDGASFIAAGSDFKGARGIYRIDAKTGQTARVVTRENVASPMSSPDGKTLYYGHRIDLPGATEFALVKRDLASGTETELLRRPNLGVANLSPGGRYIAVISGDPATKSSTFLVIPTAGGEPKEVIRRAQPQQASLFVWSPDDRSLLIRIGSPGDSKVEMWRALVDGTPPVKLASMVDGSVRSVSLHPDGRQIAFNVRTPLTPQEIWVTENFLPASKATK
jgi:Tol biopolymer transport system component